MEHAYDNRTQRSMFLPRHFFENAQLVRYPTLRRASQLFALFV